MNDQVGIIGKPAPELKVAKWLANVENPDGLKLAAIDAPLIYLYNFQSWCPGCHSHGFPTMKSVKEMLEEKQLADNVQFVAIQTVFEGHDQNTAERAVEAVARHGLTDIPLGHDSGDPPTTMTDYRTGGTPWTVLIGPDRRVLFNGFQLNADSTVKALADLLARIRRPTGDGLNAGASL
jgi:hypothetical protein